MLPRYLGLGDGRRKEAQKHVQALLNLFGRQEVLRAIEHLVYETHGPRPTSVRTMRKERRLRRALWAISKMRLLGFSAKEMGHCVGVDQTAISRLSGSNGSKSVSQSISDALVDAVQRLGAVRIRELLAHVPIVVIDTCCDKGSIVNNEIRDATSNTARALIRNALLIEAGAVRTARHIKAFVARVGHECCGVYVVCAPYDPDTFETTKAKIQHLERLEHELEHLVERTRAERKRLQGRSPDDGRSSGRIA